MRGRIQLLLLVSLAAGGHRGSRPPKLDTDGRCVSPWPGMSWQDPYLGINFSAGSPGTGTLPRGTRMVPGISPQGGSPGVGFVLVCPLGTGDGLESCFGQEGTCPTSFPGVQTPCLDVHEDFQGLIQSQ